MSAVSFERPSEDCFVIGGLVRIEECFGVTNFTLAMMVNEEVATAESNPNKEPVDFQPSCHKRTVCLTLSYHLPPREIHSDRVSSTSSSDSKRQESQSVIIFSYRGSDPVPANSHRGFWLKYNICRGTWHLMVASALRWWVRDLS